MADPLAYLNQCAKTSVLFSPDRLARFLDLAERRTQELQQATNSGTPPLILLTETDPIKFLSSFIAACIANCAIVLGNPHWVETEWQQVWQVIQPNLVWGDCLALPTRRPNRAAQSAPPGWIMIPTGGSSGNIRFVIHTWKTLTASVEGFRQYFAIEQVNSCCVLPLYHVSGLMQFLRSFISGGELAILPSQTLFQTLTQSPIDPSKFFLSLVPTQLHRLLKNAEAAANLKHFQTVLLGGAPAWRELLEQARQHQIRLALTYGMTETASQIATLKPEDFLQENVSCGHVLPHAHVSIGAVGSLTIQAASLALGYYPDRFFNGSFETDDLGFFDAERYLHIAGRSSQKIITGGENVFPAEVEAAIRASGLVYDVFVIGMPDPDWGEVVTAVCVPCNSEVSIANLERSIELTLSKFKRPKHWRLVKELPRNAQGKLNYQQIKQIISAAKI